MNVNPIVLKLAAAVCTLLFAVLIGEWLIAKYNAARLFDSIEAAAPPPSDGENVPRVDLDADSEAHYAELVNRPLFLKGRKPVEEASSEKEKEKEQAGSETFDWRLDGIFTSKKGLAALLSREAPQGGVRTTPVIAGANTAVAAAKPKSDNYRRVVANQDVDGWILTQIDASHAVFELGGERKTLNLLKPKPKELPPEQQKNPNAVPNGGRAGGALRPRGQNITQLQDRAQRRLHGRQQAAEINESDDPADDESGNDENNEE